MQLLVWVKVLMLLLIVLNAKQELKDEIMESWGKIDRYIYCDTCKRYEVLTMSDPNK
jgi:hypothetical protein